MVSSLKKIFTPTYRAKKLTELDQNFFEQFDLIFIDLDNTICIPETLEIPLEISNFIKNLTQTKLLVCPSNSTTSAKRLAIIKKDLNIQTTDSKKKKPFLGLINLLKKQFDLNNKKILVIGDRLFTDIVFGNRAGWQTLLVEPLSDKEYWWIKIVRKIENQITNKLTKKSGN